MFVIRLPNGNLMVPESAMAEGGRVIGDAYVEIGPDDSDYERLAQLAVTEEEASLRRQRWRDEDEALRQQFLDFQAQRENSWPGQDAP